MSQYRRKGSVVLVIRSATTEGRARSRAAAERKILGRGATYGPNFSGTGSVNLVVAGAPAEGPAMVLVRNNSITVNVKEEFSSTGRVSSGTWSDGEHTYSMHGPRLDLDVRADPLTILDVEEAPRFASLRARRLDGSRNIFPGRYWLRLNAHRGYVASATMAERIYCVSRWCGARCERNNRHHPARRYRGT